MFNTWLQNITWKEKTKAVRSIKVSCVNCRLWCYTKISHEVRVDLFDKFWSTHGEHAKQWEIIAKYDMRKVKRLPLMLKTNLSGRSHTLHFHLPKTLTMASRYITKKNWPISLNTFDTAIRKIQEINDFTDDKAWHKNRKYIKYFKWNEAECHYRSHEFFHRVSSLVTLVKVRFTKICMLCVKWCADNNYNFRSKEYC